MNANNFKLLVKGSGHNYYICDDYGNPLYLPFEEAARIAAVQRKRFRLGVFVWLVSDLTEAQDKAMADFYDKQGFVDGGV